MGPGAWTLPLARVDAAASRRVGARSRPGATFCRRAGRSLSRALVGAALKEGRRVSGTSRHLCCTCKRREGPAAVSVCPARWGLPRATAALSGRSRTGGAQAEETGRARREWRGRVGWDLSGIWGEMPSAVPAPVVLAGGGLLRRRAGGHPLGELQGRRRPREVRIEARRSPFTDGGHRTQDRRSVDAVGSLESHRSAVSGSAALQGMELRLIRCSPQRAGRLPAACPVPPAAGTTALWLRPLRRRPRRGGSRRVRSSRARWGCLPRTITTKPDRDLGQSRPHMPD